MNHGNHLKNESMTENRRLLIIDDDPGVRESFKSIFDTPGLEEVEQQGAALFGLPDGPKPLPGPAPFLLTICERGMEGVQEVERPMQTSRRFPVAFVDINMPGIDGVETARRLWKVDPQMKIVLITAYSRYRPEDVLNITHREDLFFLRKPFHPEEIRQMARALTYQWNLERAREQLSSKLSEANTRLLILNLQLEEKVEEQTTLLVQSEKMASLGLLAAGVAHEINNPISFVDSNLHTLNRYCSGVTALLEAYEELAEATHRHLVPEVQEPLEKLEALKQQHRLAFILKDMTALTAECLDGTQRVQQIVHDLRTFARCDPHCSTPVNLNDIMDATLNIIWNQLKYKTHLIKHYGSLPPIRCVPQKLSQVFMNVLMNAAQAITDAGTVRVATHYLESFDQSGKEGAWAKIEVSDDGCGIPKDNLKRVFDPFFTTKPVGQGTGLGLSIAYDIVKAHGGRIAVESQAGRGTTATILLPYAE
jgi:two-component system NtrC family sensor kinase